jgi:hypothetical protein
MKAKFGSLVMKVIFEEVQVLNHVSRDCASFVSNCGKEKKVVVRCCKKPCRSLSASAASRESRIDLSNHDQVSHSQNHTPYVQPI